MIAFHFPPVHGSSGVQRTLSFTRFLPEMGWRPHVLTVNPRAYTATDQNQLKDILPSTSVTRCAAWDSSRHLAWRGRYLKLTALPDQWMSWCVSGVANGLKIVRREKPLAIWSTYPIATAHLIALIVHRITGLPWIADFRDSMTEDDYPRDETQRNVYRFIESRTLRHAQRCVFTTPSAVRMYADRYPLADPETFHLIENGYDERIFDDVKLRRTTGRPQLKLLHSGLVYPEERNPVKLFDALAALKNAGQANADQLTVVFRASGYENQYAAELSKRGISDMVRLEPRLPYREALQEMADADGLLLLQAASCNHQIPAKLYEYFKVKRPIIGLTDPRGDTHAALSKAGYALNAPLDNAAEIADVLRRFIGGECAIPDIQDPDRSYGRRARSISLAHVLNEAVELSGLGCSQDAG